ncbi:hypothetical protein [Desulfonatronum thiodismutans]|uniref:hypothetical protein n=1 Tax=Desulfonatronum thiodismutans TaxID=159290 RepID=UPI0004ABE42B|nr:hypothetical protein [Desulfonatronum thiodismutans]
MTTRIDQLAILFAVPKWITNGLNDGSLIRRGGVIQNATNNEIVMWLREGGRLREWNPDATPQINSSLQAQLAGLNVKSDMLFGLQAVNLAVTVVGFAAVMHKLSAIDQKLDTVIDRLNAVAEDLNWLDRRKDIELLACVVAALEQASWAERTGRESVEFVRVRAQLVRAHMHYTLLLDAMHYNDRAHKHPGIYSHYFHQAQLCTAAVTRCDGLLDGTDAALAANLMLGERLTLLAQRYRDTLLNPRKHRHLLMLTPRNREQAVSVGKALKETTNRMEGHRAELEWCAREQIGWQEWESLGDEHPESDLVFVLPQR